MTAVVILSIRIKANMRRFFAISIATAVSVWSAAQTPQRVITAIRTSISIKVDGELNDEAWKMAPVMNDFIEQRPGFGKKEANNTRTEAFILYDDNAVYVAAFCHETSRDSISTELVGRDRESHQEKAYVA